MPLDPDLVEFTTASPTAINLSYLELSTGTVFQTFYLADDEQPTYFLTSNTMYSHAGYAVLTPAAEKNFDLLTQTPFTVGGQCIVNLGLILRTLSTGATVATTITIRILHVTAGAVETSLGTASTAYSASVGDLTGLWQNFAAKINLTDKVFGKGETLRLEIVATDPGANKQILTYCDPANRLDINTSAFGATTYSNSKIIVPIKTD
jgi:hypothetical protein